MIWGGGAGPGELLKMVAICLQGQSSRAWDTGGQERGCHFHLAGSDLECI